ncbi:MAG: hypothetical protein ACT4NL_09310 [Pseudomarimonas sp.]
MKTQRLKPISLAVACLLGCGAFSVATAEDKSPAPALTTQAPASQSAQTADQQQQPVADQFMGAIARHCWRSFAGKVVVNTPADPKDPFTGKPLVIHVRECSEREIRIPLHVGDDHSRTWVLTRTEAGIRLKHDHRHEDGSSDVLTMYGGDSSAKGSASRQEFPVDVESIALFEREDRKVSTTNVWAIEIDPHQKLVYELKRPGREFRVEFDLTKTVPTPPDPWGAELPKP